MTTSASSTSASPIRMTSMNLMPGVELNVFAVQGSTSSVLIDTGIAAMREQVLGLCEKVGGPKWVLLTHVHADHIGCNRAVKAATNARFAVGGCVPWVENLEMHYEEFCLTKTLGDPSGQREEIMGLMDAAVSVDRVFQDGDRFDLGGIELEVIALPGHKLEEVGFLEPDSKSLVLGDVLLALAAPFFHGFQTATGFHASLDKLEQMLQANQVEHVYSAHHPTMDTASATSSITQTRAFLNDVHAATLEAAKGVSFQEVWRNVSAKLGKTPEFRGYAMLQVQVQEMLKVGLLRVDEDRIERT